MNKYRWIWWCLPGNQNPPNVLQKQMAQYIREPVVNSCYWTFEALSSHSDQHLAGREALRCKPKHTHTHTRTAPVICIIQQNLNDRSLFQCVVVLRPSNHSNAVYGVRSPARPYLYIIMFERSSFHPCWLPCAMRPRHSVEYTSFENCSQHYIMPRICDSRRWICAICDQPCKQKLAKRRTTGRAGRIDGAWPWLFKQHAISRFVWFVYRIGDDRGK